MIIRALACLTLAGVLALMPTPASAREPGIYFPFYTAEGVEVTSETIYVEAGDGTWNSRQAARRWAALVPGLNIHIGPCVPFEPCVRVHVGAYQHRNGNPGIRGWCVFTSGYERDIYLTTLATPQRGLRRTAMHEMGHALGLAHHNNTRGVMSMWSQATGLQPSRGEIRALTEQFGPRM